ncbi:MAG: cAMP-binding protein [Rhodospirillaceae bacterium]|nr:MAG: cAMP-binding protein [Rhodospirillaceae bacterium]
MVVEQYPSKATRDGIGMALKTVLAWFERLALSSDDITFREGDGGDISFVVEPGMIEISKRGADSRALVLGTIRAGSMFGEMALIDGQPRMADAIAMGPTQCIILPRALFLAETARLSPFACTSWSIPF